MAEAEELEAVERERARRRKGEAGKANLPTVSAGNVSTTHEDKGRARDLEATFPQGRCWSKFNLGRQEVNIHRKGFLFALSIVNYT